MPALTRQAKNASNAKSQAKSGAAVDQTDPRAKAAAAPYTGKKRGRPPKNQVAPKSINSLAISINTQGTEVGQIAASTSQLSAIRVSTKSNKRPRKAKAADVVETPIKEAIVLSQIPPTTESIALARMSLEEKERTRQEDVDAMMELRAPEEILDMPLVEHLPPPTVTDDVISEKAKGKRRATQTGDTPKPSPSKRAKIAAPSTATVKIVRVKKPKTKAISSGKTGKIPIPKIDSIKWKVLEPVHDTSRVNEESLVTETALRPRIWTTNREELLAMLPEMTGSKCYNGVSWELYETPLLLLDKANTSFQIDRDGGNPLSLDIITTRAFICPRPQQADIQKWSVIDLPRPPSPFVAPSPSERPPAEKAKPKQYRRRYKSPAVKQEAGLNPTLSSVSVPGYLAPEILPSSLPSVMFKFHEAGQALPSPMVGGNFDAANGSVLTTKVEPLSNYYPGVDSTNFMDMAFNIAAAAYQGMYHSPAPFLEGAFSHHAHGPMQIMSAAVAYSAPSLSYPVNVPEHCSDDGNQQFTPAPSVPSDPTGIVLSPDVGSVQTEPTVSYPQGKANSQAPLSMKETFSACSENLPVLGTSASGSQNLFIMKDEESDAMNLVDPDDPNPITVATTVDATTAIDTTMANETAGIKDTAVADDILRDCVPSPIPEELDAFIDSYLFGRPLTIIVSRELLEEHWSLKLPSEYGYAMMGYFKILGVQETRNPMDGDNDTMYKAQGQVQWKFHLRWAPGGEDSIFEERDPSDFDHPWWNPPPPASEKMVRSSDEPLTKEVTDVTVDPEDAFPTTPRYRDARMRHHEYKFRHYPLTGLYESVVPLHLLIPYGQDYMDSAFPRGWCCRDCGRMNFQYALRHRKCPSSLCKDKAAPVSPYAQSLFLLRDPQERLPLSSPLNHYPESLTTTTVTRSKNGMQTFAYYLLEDSNVSMKHIFTSNAPPLQKDATTLLDDIQISVPIFRPLAESTPYFIWSAMSPKENVAPTNTQWDNIPLVMNQAKELIVNSVRLFGGFKEDQVAVNKLSILAWITAGSKKGDDPIRAKKTPVVFFALGCTIVLVVTPKSLGGMTTLVDKAHDAESGQFPKSDIVDHDEPASGWIADIHEGAEESIESPKKAKTIAKSSKPNFVITLMHGDMVVFYGDEFEYSVKRDGTSLLLIASHDSLEHA